MKPTRTHVADQDERPTPVELDLRYQRANGLRLGGRPAEAERAYRAVLAVDPQHADAAAALAFMLRESGRVNAAAAAMLASWQARPKRIEDSEKTARFLRECDAWDAVLMVCEEQLRLTPGHARLLGLAGDADLVLGRFSSAAQRLREALDRDPGLARPWLRLAQTRRFDRADDPDIERFRAAAGDRRLGDVARSCAAFALGKALDDLDDHAGAAIAFTAANRTARQQSAWSADAWREFVAARSAERPLPPSALEPGFLPVFIVGLPRSGTTLLARLLEQHPDVRNRGELNWANAFAGHLETRAAADRSNLIDQFSRIFAAQLRRDDAPARFYIDKNPLNFRHLDLIAALFPGARVIHCRRERRDTALSLWCQHFAHEDLGFAYDFADIAAFAEGHDRLMAHWLQRGALPILDLEYESLVAAPQSELARVGDFLGLGARPVDSPANLLGDGAIATASVWQARQPIHTRSVGRWRHYREWLPELDSAFATPS